MPATKSPLAKSEMLIEAPLIGEPALGQSGACMTAQVIWPVTPPPIGRSTSMFGVLALAFTVTGVLADDETTPG